MKTTFRLLVLTVLLALNLSCITPEPERRYRAMLRQARGDSAHLTFMQLRSYLQEYPASPHVREIRFAIAEYYLQVNNHAEAIRSLTGYLNDFQGGDDIVFAQALLYKALSEYKKEPLLMEKIKKNFFSKSLFLTFSGSKVKSYRSILDNVYKVVDYIDNMEIFKNNEIFLKVTP